MTSPTRQYISRPSMLVRHDTSNLSMSGNLTNNENYNDRVPDNGLQLIQDNLNDYVTQKADSPLAVVRKLTLARTSWGVLGSSFVRVIPTGPPKQQSIRPGWKFEANLINIVKTATICYARSLNRLYVEPYNPFSMQFNLTPLEGSARISEWFVRCTAVYTAPEYEHSVVRRCENKTHNRLPVEGALGIVEVVEGEAYYCGSGAPNTHYSVVVPLQAPSTTARYQMTCLRSCPLPGVNRRALALDFTAEDDSGAVYGRHRILVHPCTKPRRNLKNEKARLAQKNMERARSTQSGPRSKSHQVQTLPRDQLTHVDETKNAAIADLSEYEKCLLRLKEASRYNRYEDIAHQINRIIEKVERKKNLKLAALRGNSHDQLVNNNKKLY